MDYCVFIPLLCKEESNPKENTEAAKHECDAQLLAWVKTIPDILQGATHKTNSLDHFSLTVGVFDYSDC